MTQISIDGLSTRYIHHARPLKAIIVGGGPSGLLMAYKFQRNFVNLEWTIYEKNADIGGTWYENRYPGCRCDVPSHTYVYTFDQEPGFPDTYPSTQDIWNYFKDFQLRHKLQLQTQLSCEVIQAVWSDCDSKWSLTIRNRNKGTVLTDSCDVLINAVGFLNQWKWPDISCMDKYKGELVHTATWPSDLDLTDKRVIVIGNGSSGVQVAPAILPVVSQLILVQRQPAWIASQGSTFRPYTEKEKASFLQRPDNLLKLRKWLEHSANKAFPIFVAGSERQADARQRITAHMTKALKDHPLRDELIPKVPVGCRRLAPGHGYLETLNHTKTRVILGQPEKFTETGIKVNGELVDADVVICATGFETSYIPSLLVTARDKTLSQEWRLGPRSYLGIATSHFPNYFTVLGPNSPVGNGPIMIGMESQIDYICKLVTRLQLENIKSIAAKTEAVDDFLAFRDSFMQSTVWSHPCNSWYKTPGTERGISALWPGSTLHYVETIKDVRWEDYEISYHGNRFDYLGNGMSRLESYNDADLSCHIRRADDGPILGSKFEYIKAPDDF